MAKVDLAGQRTAAASNLAGHMRIVFLNRFFHPDHSATSQLLSDLAIHLARRGQVVTVVTSRMRYDDPEARIAAREQVEGVDIRRVWTSRLGRGRLLSRATDYATFYASSLWTLMQVAKSGDVVVAKTDPPLIGVPATLVARLRGASVVHWSQDLYPETAEELGILKRSGRVARLLRHLRNWSLRQARHCVALGEGMARRFEALGVAQGSIAVIPNWVDETLITPLEPTTNPLRRTWNLEGRFVVAYSGNLGRAHDFTTLLEAAVAMRGDGRVAFLFIGGGHGMEALRKAVEERGLRPLFQFRPYQDQAALRTSLGIADVHWVSLQPSLEGLIVPSKIYGILAAGRPAIMIGDPDGEVGRILARAACGLCVREGDATGLVTALRSLMADEDKTREMGRRARALAEQEFSRERALAAWTSLLVGQEAPGETS